MNHLDIWEYLKLPNIKPKWTRHRNLRSFKCAKIQRQHICVIRPPTLFIVGEIEGQLNQTPVPSPLKHTKSSSGPITQSHTGHYMVPEISSSPPDTIHLPEAHSGLGGRMCPYLPTGSLEWTLLWYYISYPETKPGEKLLMSTVSHVVVSTTFTSYFWRCHSPYLPGT